PVSSGQLAVLDVANMPNGFYVLRLTAHDIGRRVARTEAVVEVRTATKRAYERREIDLTVSLAGTTVAVTREYDSTRRDVQGKFGYGGRLPNRKVALPPSTCPPGHEDQGLYSPYRAGTRLYLSAPNGDEVGFVFNPVRHQQPGVAYYTPAWDPLPGSPTG